MATRICQTFAALKESGRMAFMPFVTAGDPDVASTCRIIEELASRDVDLIEVGFPYSDPIADGPVIQASYTRALERGVTVESIFAHVGELPTEELPPLVAMVAYSIIFRFGAETFLEHAANAGFSGLIVPDLPGDEASDFFAATSAHGLDLVQLVAPTTPPDRARRILQSAGGFVYCISIAGTTGVRDELPPELRDQLKWLRTQTELPLAVGFGISRPEQVGTLRGDADGIIVGSALVKHLAAVTEDGVPFEEARTSIGEFAADMSASAHEVQGR